MKKLFDAASAYFNKKTAVIGAGVVTVVASNSAFAVYTLPAPVTAAFTDMGEAWGLIEANIWPILATVVIGFFVIRMFKRGAKTVG